MHFLCETIYRQYRAGGKQLVGGALKTLAKPLKCIFDEVHFIVNLLYQIPIKKYEDDMEH